MFDFNNDGRLDILVTDMHSDMVGYDVAPQDEKLKFPPEEEPAGLPGRGQQHLRQLLLPKLGRR